MKKRISFFSTFLLVLSFTFCSLGPASSVQGGSDATGDSRVVALIFGSNTRASCSGVPINSYVVVAAAHCLSNPNFTYGNEVFIPKGMSIAAPGADLTKDNQANRARVLQVAVNIGFNEKSAADDIAFYFLDRPIMNTTFLPIANSSEFAKIKSAQQDVTHIGYGYILPGNVEDYRPHKITLKAISISSSLFNIYSPSEDQSISTEEVQGQALCKHDSGGPFIATINGSEKLLAINLLADGCDRYGAGIPVKGTLGLAIFPYLDLLERNWILFTENNSSLSNLNDAKYKLADALTSARKTPVSTVTPLASKSPAPSPDPSPATKAAPNSLTITCVKGKVTKAIKAVKPVCPSGYKKK